MLLLACRPKEFLEIVSWMRNVLLINLYDNFCIFGDAGAVHLFFKLSCTGFVPQIEGLDFIFTKCTAPSLQKKIEWYLFNNMVGVGTP